MAYKNPHCLFSMAYALSFIIFIIFIRIFISLSKSIKI